jgi:hypothetical protein
MTCRGGGGVKNCPPVLIRVKTANNKDKKILKPLGRQQNR